ncbi:BZ3500_MvSof-1268-A1-R1_Chr7-1g09206 [Microbotryum saponariae]|uniref:BZ3500_MvSof-1268-A1-R1_Chr7-1g09206 protein n=1 Tax=Microbotryum saponariae TaxID=289078 RepID=A0A2X0N1Y1_9BASI|nr:BZ3501_MvSof-1269-A2-R1_Chr7-1g08911 [Microbotryum saponariae]SDA02995.1 BZ3500_MvSof-1268-A1-R1_Chr7-1g09206 [Microbotryum saponariae]
MLTTSWLTRHAASLATRTTCSSLSSTTTRSSSGSSGSSGSPGSSGSSGPSGPSSSQPSPSPSPFRNCSSSSSPLQSSPSSAWSHRTFTSTSASAVPSQSSTEVSSTTTSNTPSTSSAATTPPSTLSERVAHARRLRSSPSDSASQEQLVRTSSSNSAEAIDRLLSKSIASAAQAANQDTTASASKSDPSQPDPNLPNLPNLPNGTISSFARQFTPQRPALRRVRSKQRASTPPTHNEMLEATAAEPRQSSTRRAAPSTSTSTSSPASAPSSGWKSRRVLSSRLPLPSHERVVSKTLWQLNRLEGRLTAAERTLASLETPWEALDTEARSTLQKLYQNRIQRELSGPSKTVPSKHPKESDAALDDTGMGDIDHLVHVARLSEVPRDDSPFFGELHGKRKRLHTHLVKTLQVRQGQLQRKLAWLQRERLPPPGSSTSSTRNATRLEPELPPLPPRSDYSNFLTAASTPVTVLPQSPAPIAKLTHGLQRVLFNPGVHFLQDPRSRVWNFPRGLLNDVPPIEDFDQSKLPRYVTSSEDKDLMALAQKEGKKLVGSTSSTVAMLCQIYFWISKGKEVNLEMLSSIWAKQNKDFSMGQQLPASVELLYEDGRYSIDADKSIDVTSGMNVLADYGHMMEKLLTTDQPEFRRFLKSSLNPAASEVDQRQAYHYMATDHMVLRSQLDAHDPHLPNVSFDLKTRGTIAIRQDRLNYIEGAGYTVDRLRGLWNSFEREYYDLIRSAFLKYQFQARIGHMDGCFVAYHSTRTFYGFQYVPIEEMDVALFGNHETGNQIFRLALGFLERILLEATSLYPERSIRMTFAASPKEDVLRVFVTPQSSGGSTTDDVAGPLTLLEYRGTNYVNGQPVRHVMIGPREDTPAPPTPKPAADEAPVRTTPPHLLPSKWEIGYSVTRSSTSDPDGSPLPPQEVRSMLASVRATQRMFSTLYLPSGISLHDLEDARKRVAAAYETGEEPSEDDLKLIKMLPEREGMKYGRPSKLVSQLRMRAKSNAKTNEQQESDDETSGHYEMRSTLVSRKNRLEEQ